MELKLEDIKPGTIIKFKNDSNHIRGEIIELWGSRFKVHFFDDPPERYFDYPLANAYYFEVYTKAFEYGLTE